MWRGGGGVRVIFGAEAPGAKALFSPSRKVGAKLRRPETQANAH